MMHKLETALHWLRPRRTTLCDLKTPSFREKAAHVYASRTPSGICCWRIF